MEITDHDADPTTDPLGDPQSGPPGTNGESASDLYNADDPPFGELPEKPAKTPSMPGGSLGPAPGDPVGAPSRRVQLGAGAVVALLALLLLRRRRRRRRTGAVGRRSRRS